MEANACPRSDLAGFFSFSAPRSSSIELEDKAYANSSS
jgi:hypothetical protein